MAAGGSLAPPAKAPGEEHPEGGGPPSGSGSVPAQAAVSAPEAAPEAAPETLKPQKPPTPAPTAAGGEARKRPASPTVQARAAKMTRIRKACDICRMRKVKCDGVSPCQPCQALGAQCSFQYVSRHRGPVSRFAGGAWADAGTAGAAGTAEGGPAAGTADPAAHPTDPVTPAAGNASLSPGLGLFAPVYMPQPARPQPARPQPPLPSTAALPHHAADSTTLADQPPFHTAPPVIPYPTVYPHIPQPQPQPPLPAPAPPPSATDAIAPFHVLALLVDDFFTYIHPLIPFPHEPTFRRRFADPHERQTPQCLALLASMIGCLAASFPRSVRPHLRARHHQTAGGGSGGDGGGDGRTKTKFARAVCMVECCRDVALRARGAAFYVKPVLSVDDAATSYFLGLAAGYTFDWRLCRRFMAEAMSFVQELGFHRPASHAFVNNTSPPALYVAPPPFNHVDDQIGKRIFWILYLAMRSLIQLGATLSETPLPPFNHARPFPDLPAEVDDAYIEPRAIRAQPAGTVSLITGFNKTIQIYATMDPIATLEYACGLHQVPVAAQRAMFVDALSAAKAITDTLPDELYLPLPGGADASAAADEPAADEPADAGRAPGSDSSTPIEVLYDDLPGYRYYPPAADDAARTSPAVSLTVSTPSPRNPGMPPGRHAGAPPGSGPARRPDDLRLLLGTDPARRRQVQYDIQKTNIYASQLATRSYFVEMYLQLRTEAETLTEAEAEASPMAGERERIVHSLLFVLAAIPQHNMEPNGSALINKIRQVASTILGTTTTTTSGTKGTEASPMEAQLIRFLEILIRLEKTGGPGRPSTSTAAAAAASTVSSEEDVDEEEELQNWASLREEQMRFAAGGGFLYNYV